MELLCYDAHNCLLAILTQADTFMITNKIWCERFCLPDASCQYQYRLLTCSFTHCSVENGHNVDNSGLQFKPDLCRPHIK
ncbi:Hypothetical protein SMAX5B_018229 [Scophthalmus maximus]|uniref:Uncharacterized protein n=1 Tax=Scophthalmus maximus TaxID=52904 RepID=A0A2U9C8R2_SCOMX|nr:Hypothetical protein SMAX5B_018229 [Scophthalmus maximus]KAF0026229.1 hypothetical protein F2P81_020966 [Scophthalmus maximus]